MKAAGATVKKFEMSEEEAKMNGAPTGEIFTVELLERWVGTGVCDSSGFPKLKKQLKKGGKPREFPFQTFPNDP